MKNYQVCLFLNEKGLVTNFFVKFLNKKIDEGQISSEKYLVYTLQTFLSMFLLFRHFPQMASNIFFLNTCELNGSVKGSPVKKQ